MVTVSACCGGWGEVQQLADFSPRVLLIAGVADGRGDHLLGLGDEASQTVQRNRAVAVESARPVPRGRECSNALPLPDEVEQVIDEVKTHQRGSATVLRFRKPEMVEQEIWGACWPITGYGTS